MKKSVLYSLTLFAVFLTTACDEPDLNNLDAKTLVKWDCKSTGQSFINNDQQCVTWGRGCTKWVDKPTRYYVYECKTAGRVLSKYKLEYTAP